MNNFFKILLIIVVSLSLGFVYGYYVHKDQVFPYKALKTIKMRNLYKNSMQWSIGIYSGDSPFCLTDPKEIDNPVISARDIHDVDAAFVADPFLVVEGESYFLFFEVLNMETYTGDIGYAVSEDGVSWEYKKIILDEEFHLSYPSIYQWKGQYYMIPESSQDSTIRIYRAISFPDKWIYVDNLISGIELSDPTVFTYKDKYWMFASKTNSDLYLYFSDSLLSGWKAHPMNPIIENNPHISRPAGNVFEYEGKLYRVAQDCFPYYGMRVYASEILVLSETNYYEDQSKVTQIASNSNQGWNKAGMHQVDLHFIEGKWYAVVDGIRRRP